MVELYNYLKFVVVTEERIGLPGIGAFEAMACGCALNGLESPDYEDIRMQPGVHHFAHKDDFDPLIACVHQARANPAAAAAVAEAGRHFVPERLNERVVVTDFFDQIRRQVRR